MKADMWQLHDQGYWVVVPTNCEYLQDSKNGTSWPVAIMGGGIARQAANRFPGLPYRYGESLKNGVEFYEDHESRTLCYPTKVYIRHDSQWGLVLLTVLQLQRFVERNPTMKVVVPAIGCGLGGLEWEYVSDALEPLRQDQEHFIVLDPIEL